MKNLKLSDFRFDGEERIISYKNIFLGLDEDFSIIINGYENYAILASESQGSTEDLSAVRKVYGCVGE
jgi:hypothetical protein